MSHKLVIIDDLFSIAARLKNIDNGYYIVYDRSMGRYEVHNSKYRDTLQLVLPYSTLDNRAVDYVNITRIRNPYDLLLEIEEHNSKLEASRLASSMAIIGDKVKSQVEYEERTGKSAPTYDLL